MAKHVYTGVNNGTDAVFYVDGVHPNAKGFEMAYKFTGKLPKLPRKMKKRYKKIIEGWKSEELKFWIDTRPIRITALVVPRVIMTAGIIPSFHSGKLSASLSTKSKPRKSKN